MITVLFEDENIIVAEKPAGMESQATRKLEPDMVSEIRKHIHKLSTSPSGKKGEPYVGVIHRLDKPVGGIMVYAKTRQAAASLSRQVQDGTMKKTYLALVCGKPVDNVGNFVDFLLKDEKANYSRVVEKGTEGGKEARLSYRTVSLGKADGRDAALVEIDLHTGRHHQIRVQFASRGIPLVGDEKYGSGREPGRRPEPLALYAGCLEFLHPVSGRQMRFSRRPSSGAFRRYEELETVAPMTVPDRS